MEDTTTYLPVALFVPMVALLGVALVTVGMIYVLRRRRRRQRPEPRDGRPSD